ncbi:MAG: hypothetical protein HFJ43_05050 [Clostridia bacterium]|nr:hypothetical protein [Clostridia bacterium]
MNKLNKIFITIIVVLIIILTFITYQYVILKENSKKALDDTLRNAEELYEANKKIQELESELESYKK